VANRKSLKSHHFLLYHSLVPARNAPFFAHSVSKYLAFSNRNEDPGPNPRVQKFLNHLKPPKKIVDG
jgi:hypothetical protein